ncbi:MAG TPA: glycoside hydrolase [Phycisphaerae bacterium]|nr:glycoside hydrolase [Phycisphaerae bacterium]
MRVEIDSRSGAWFVLDKASNVRWPTEGAASPGSAAGLGPGFDQVDSNATTARLAGQGRGAVVFELLDAGRCLEIRYEGKELGDVRVLEDALAVTDREAGSIVVPCREGLLIPADGDIGFKQTFGTSEYEGCHMNMLGLLKKGAALAVTWDDAYVWADVQRTLSEGQSYRQKVTAALTLKRSARSLRVWPLGKGDWNVVAAGYRRIAEAKGLAGTLHDRIRRDPHTELLLGAANVKLWTCLDRRMNDDGTKEESVKVHWTFGEAAQIAEHLHEDLGISRCLFILGGWTEGGYDCRHPDNLPANPECGGNQALADAIRRVQALGYVACLHDNYQDMYRGARSWDPACIEKRADGSLIEGGRWLGGRAYMVCAVKQLDMAMRPQNLPQIRKLFNPWCYFIDTTYAVGPRECADPSHPIGRNDDIAWKSTLGDKARELFGLFGSECGREWALPHSDFFEGLTGVAGHPFHNLRPETLGARVIPFWEMVYHDCQVCYGKYEYDGDQAGEYVACHVLSARPLNYHSIPDHLYWKDKVATRPVAGDRACYARTDGGWAEGLHPTDAFLKNTQEILGPLHRATAHDRLTRLEFLTPNGAVRRATYGQGHGTTVVVNLGADTASVQSELGGAVLLPPWGFVVESRRFAAFYAAQWGGRSYPRGALFTIQAAEDRDLVQAAKIRVFHGFGDPQLNWRGKTLEVRREQTVDQERAG